VHWLEITSGHRRNDDGIKARDAGSGHETAEDFCPTST